MNYSYEQLEDKYKTLPNDVRAAMDSVEIGLQIEEFGKKYKLHIDKLEELSDETSLVMLGFTNPKDYMNNLKKRLEIPEDLAREIVADVNEQIFKPIRGSLMKIHGTAKEGELGLAKAENPKFAPPAKISTPITSPLSAQLELTAPMPSLDKADTKILKDSGIELEKAGGGAAKEQIVPKKEDIVSAIENRGATPKGEMSWPAGFAVVRRSASAEIIPPEKKLGEPSAAPGVISPVAVKSPPEKPPTPAEQKKADPYREPIT